MRERVRERERGERTRERRDRKRGQVCEWKRESTPWRYREGRVGGGGTAVKKEKKTKEEGEMIVIRREGRVHSSKSLRYMTTSHQIS